MFMVNNSTMSAYFDIDMSYSKDEVWIVEDGIQTNMTVKGIYKTKDSAIAAVKELMRKNKQDYHGEHYYVDHGTIVTYIHGAYAARATLVEIQ